MNQENTIKAIQEGKIFLYPTDTVYGIGCNALATKAVEKIKQLKKRNRHKPLSIIAPSISWILKNLKTTKTKLNKYLPGKYTLILKKRDPKFLEQVSNLDTIGIRIPKHKFTKIIQKANVPFITTSANLSGSKPITHPDQLPQSLTKKIDIIINAGKLSGRASTIILPDDTKLER